MEQPKYTPFKRISFQMLCQVAVVLLLCTGCSKRYSDIPAFWPYEFKDHENQSVGRFKTTFLAEQIDRFYLGVNPGPIGVTTFVNLDDLRTTSSFGRVAGEQLMSELSMLGYDVVELRHADALHFLTNTGEFALSRDVTQVRRARDLGAIIVGTYVVSPVRVYLNARLVDPATSRVLSAGSVEMEKTEEITRLVRGGSFSPTLERIPVRKLGIYSYPWPMFGGQGARYDMEESMPMVIPEPKMLDSHGKSAGKKKL